MSNLLDIVRRHRGVAAAFAVGAAFVVGLLVGGQRSGSAAEWAAAVGTVLAAGVALAIATDAGRQAREERVRQWRSDVTTRSVDLASELLLVIEKDRLADGSQNHPGLRRSPEGIALVARILAAGYLQLGVVGEHYDPSDQYAQHLQHVRTERPGESYWRYLHDECTHAIQEGITRTYDYASEGSP